MGKLKHDNLITHPSRIKSFIPIISPGNLPIAILVTYSPIKKSRRTRWKSTEESKSYFNKRWKIASAFYYYDYDREVSKLRSNQIVFFIPN
jgi:hypothetical protein